MGQSCSDGAAAEPGEVVVLDDGREDGAAEEELLEIKLGGPARAVLAAELLSPDEVAERQAEIVREAVELLDISADYATMLLRSKAWSFDALSEDYFADAFKVRHAAGIVDEVEGDAAEGDVCMICYVEAPMKLLQCGHSSYCKACWERYARSSVQESAACLALRCPTQKCTARLRPSDFESLCSPELFARYSKFEREDFVNSSTTMAWCPGPRCDKVAKLPASAEATPVACPCGTQWCSRCKADLHTPVSCEVVREWGKLHKSADDKWISMNTKPCPKCKRPIEKNGGCMHMTCSRQTGCGHEFCWICLGDWSLHGSGTGGFYACNRYVPKDETRASAQRYFHFCDRYFGHERAQHFAATEQLDGVRVLADSICSGAGEVTAKQVETLEDAVKLIISCRRFLKWTYAHAAVVTIEAAQQELFDFHQAQLEGTLERLSDIMENTAWADYARQPAHHPRPFTEVRGQVAGLMHVIKEAFAKLAASIQPAPGGVT